MQFLSSLTRDRTHAPRCGSIGPPGKSGNYSSDFHSHRWVLPVPGLHINGVIQCTYSSRVWLFPHNVIFLRLIYVAVCINNLFLFIAGQYPTVQIYLNLFNRSPIDEHLHCFQGLAIRNKATINVLTQFFSRHMISFLLEFLDHERWIFIRKCQFSKVAVPFYPFGINVQEIQLFHSFSSIWYC